jgi:hypothetical protein
VTKEREKSEKGEDFNDESLAEFDEALIRSMLSQKREKGDNPSDDFGWVNEYLGFDESF